MTGRLVLWDIDGTLIRGGSVARDVFGQAVARVIGRDLGEHNVVMGGKTDPQIALEILTFAEVMAEEADRHLPVVLGHLEAELAERAEDLRAGGTVLAGVEKVLERLHRREDVVQSVLTGNTRANAALKLGVFGLDRWVDLEIGAFGSDDADRRRLVPIAVRRAEQKTGLTFTPDQVWVIGDTPNDLACATAAGARCVLVGTGHVPIEALRDIGADAVLEDLTDVDALVELLAG